MRFVQLTRPDMMRQGLVSSLRIIACSSQLLLKQACQARAAKGGQRRCAGPLVQAVLADVSHHAEFAFLTLLPYFTASCYGRGRREQPEAVRQALVPALLAGAASHHAGALPGWKSLVEGLFQRGLLKVPPGLDPKPVTL